MLRSDGKNGIHLSMYHPDSHGVKTEINGIEMQEVRDIALYCSVANGVTLRLEQNVTKDLDVTLNGHVEPTCVFYDDRFDVEVTHPAPGTTRYRAVRRKDQEHGRD